MRKVLCFCDLIPHMDLATRLVVIMHHRETKLTSNTGQLATLTLRNSELRVRGKPGQPFVSEGLQSEGRTILLLYPSDDAQVLTPELVASLPRPITLVAPDGNWRQASKVGNREPALKHALRVKLAPGAPSTYRLRTEPHSHGLATLEAIARALGVIESPEVQQKLEYIFRIMVERTLWGRGLLKTEDCFGGVPPAALNANFSDP